MIDIKGLIKYRNVIGGGSGGSGGGSKPEIKYIKTTVTTTGKYGERVSFSIGFKPDMLLMFPNDGGTVANSKQFFGVGFSEKISGGQTRAYISSSKAFESSTYSTPIETALGGTNMPFYDADETGFTLGMTAESGKYTIIAIAFE